jgi:ATP-dependent Clp protease ATP-binding subunit ClpC
LLQVLEDGRLTDSKGRLVDFRNTILIMTSNVGASELKRSKSLGFTMDSEDQNFKDMKAKVTEELKKAFRPEFLNRIDETIVFHPLEKKHMKDIVTLMADQLKKRLAQQDIEFTLTDAVIEKIANDGFDAEYGARPLRRAIQKNIEDLLSEELLRENISKGQQVNIDVDKEGKYVVTGK